MNHDMKKIIKESFTKTPDVLESIKKDSRFRIPEKTHNSIFSLMKINRYKMTFASIFILLLLVVLGINLNTNTQVYASTVTIDINPSIEITLDENDLVISIRALNDDGETMIERNIQYQKMNIDQVMSVLIKRAIDLEYITEDEIDNIIYIHVEGSSDSVKERVRQHIEESIYQEMIYRNRQGRVIRSDQFDLTLEQRNQIQSKALELGITPGKMIYIFSIDSLDIDDEYTLEELAQMNMRQLYRIEQQFKQKGNQYGN